MLGKQFKNNTTYDVSFLDNKTIDAKPINGDDGKAKATIYRVTHEDGWHADIAFCEFTISRDIRCLFVSPNSPVQMHRLTHGLRMSVKRTESGSMRWMEASVAQMNKAKSPDWSNSVKLNLAEWNVATKLEVKPFLEDLGCEVGTREYVLGDDSRRRSYLCVAFERENIEAAIATYFLARVLPLANAYDGTAQKKLSE
jgi:hypothetical protein